MSGRGRAISKRDVEHLAWLARTELSREEKEIFAEQLSRILAYFRKIDEVNTQGVPPTHHVLNLANVFRPDEARPFPAEEIFRGIPKTKGRLVKAPKMA